MVIKLSSQMIPVPEITEQLKRVRAYVLRWIDRFNSEGLEGLNPRPKSGRPRKYTREYDEKIEALKLLSMNALKTYVCTSIPGLLGN